MSVTAEPGDVILVARLDGARWVARYIQRLTGSWYSHAMVCLGNGRYAHAVPAPGGSVVVMDEDGLVDHIDSRTVYDLFRPAEPVDALRLRQAVFDIDARSRQREPVIKVNPCGRISEFPGAIFSDGCLLVLGILKAIQDFLSKRPGLEPVLRFRNAFMVTADDSEGRLFCSKFVHLVMDTAGSRLRRPPPGESFLDLSDFPTDEPLWETLGPGYMFDWIAAKLLRSADIDERSLKTISEVLATARCHFDLCTAVPTLSLANFLTPSDLARSPSLQKIASRYELPTWVVTGWTEPLDLPPFVVE